MRKFEVVSDGMRKHPMAEIILPKRATKLSMAYDLYAPVDYVIGNNDVVKIWTDVKAAMNDSDCLMINIRSSMGGKFELLNTVGFIDGDYYNNPQNDGNIGVFLRNVSGVTQEIHAGDRIAQGVFLQYLVTDDDESGGVRTGGYGSTNREQML